MEAVEMAPCDFPPLHTGLKPGVNENDLETA